MTDFPGSAPSPPPFLHTYSAFSGVRDACQAHNAFPTPGSSGWNSGNLARYVPMTIPFPYPVRRVFWGNGSSAGGNFDFGIYTQDGARIYSTGSTGGSGNSAPQFVTLGTPVLLRPGDYYFALNHDASTANRVWGSAAITAEIQRWGGIYQQAVGAVTLPASATFATATQANVALCGITWTTSGF